MPALPNLLVIGGMKCGSSSLHHYLGQHPEIQMSQPKELNFFTWQKRSSTLGQAWYESHFDPSFAIRGESSPGYTFFPYAQGAPERAAQIVPGARLVYLVRDPIDRIVSHYVHRRAAGREDRCFSQILETLDGEAEHQEVETLPGPHGYLVRSLFNLQLEQWRAFFPDSNILVIDQAALRRDRAGALAEVADFLGVGRTFPSEGISKVHNPSEGKRHPSGFGTWARRVGRATGARSLLPDSVRASLIASQVFTRSFEIPHPTADQRAYLADLLRDDVERLRAFTGKSFSSWSV